MKLSVIFKAAKTGTGTETMGTRKTAVMNLMRAALQHTSQVHPPKFIRPDILPEHLQEQLTRDLDYVFVKTTLFCLHC